MITKLKKNYSRTTVTGTRLKLMSIHKQHGRAVHSVLSAILEKNATQLDDESLRTYLCECEAIINSSPLTVTNLNDPGSMEPLIPSHLLTLKSRVVLHPAGMFQTPDLYSRKPWRRVQHLANEFWCRCNWRKEFLLSLQQRTK